VIRFPVTVTSMMSGGSRSTSKSSVPEIDGGPAVETWTSRIKFASGSNRSGSAGRFVATMPAPALLTKASQVRASVRKLLKTSISRI
jgi:hypothetical protein